MYGKLLAKYLQKEENLFIISSDFCHWGTRFRYTYYTDTNDDNRPIQLSKFTVKQISRPIYQSIKDLDFRGIDTLEARSFSDFQNYLSKTKNTICGRHPIAVLMAALDALEGNHTVKCLHYDQSSHAKKYEDSSVSYASLYIKIE